MDRKDKYNKLIEILGKIRLLFEEPLSKYSSFRIGGSADIFVKAGTINELIKAVITARNLDIPFFILGGGTNLLIGDRGFRGLVIRNETNGIRLVGAKGSKSVYTVYLEADSGVGVNRLVRTTLDQGLAGLEAFLGQPGSIGGAVYINAHNMKLGKFFCDNLFAAKLLDREDNIKKVPKSYFKFGYDQSIIQQSKEIILSVIFKLEKKNRESLWQSAQQTLDYRATTQPRGIFSSGCTFRNIDKSDAVRIAAPNYTCSAGFLLESVGLKGVKRGGAMFSPKHANFIIHKGDAKAFDVLELINLAKRKVKERFNITLKEEIVLIGEF